MFTTNRRLLIQFCKFAAVGITSLIVDYGLMIFLTENSALGYFKACAFSYTMSVLVNYILSVKFVFQVKEDMSKTKEASIFFVLSLIGLLLNQIFMLFFVDFLGIYYAAAKLLSTLLVTSYNFVSRKKCLE